MTPKELIIINRCIGFATGVLRAVKVDCSEFNVHAINELGNIHGIVNDELERMR